MRLTRWSHACVTLESAGRVLVVDPGIWSEPRALEGAHAVLVTHEHGDHADPERLGASGLPVWAPRGADLGAVPFTPVDPDQSFTVEGFAVRAVGGRHAAIVPDQEVCANLGYVVTADGESVYHPGDALARPDVPVTTLLVPMQGNWLKTVEAIEFVRAVGPERAVGIHDGMVNDRARSGTNHWLATEGGAEYHWLAPGTTLGEAGARPRVGQLRLVVEAAGLRGGRRLLPRRPRPGRGARPRGRRRRARADPRRRPGHARAVQPGPGRDDRRGRGRPPGGTAAARRLRGRRRRDRHRRRSWRRAPQLVAPPTRTPWESLNSRLEAPADLQITLFEEACA